MKLDKLSTALINNYPDKAAKIVEKFTLNEQVEFFRLLDHLQSAALLSHMTQSISIMLLSKLPTEQASQTISVMPPSIAALLLRAVPNQERKLILDSLSNSMAKDIKSKLTFPKETVGSMMDSLVTTLPTNISMYEANKMAKRFPDYTFSKIFVLDENRKLVGHIDLKDLWKADRKDNINSYLKQKMHAIRPNVQLSKAMMHADWIDTDVMPITNKSDEFLGVLHHKDLKNELGLMMEEPGKDRELMETMVAFSELFWNAGAEFFSDAAAKKHLKRDKKSGH